MKVTQNFSEKRIKFIKKIQVDYSLVCALILFFVGVMIALVLTNSFNGEQQESLVTWIVIPVLLIFALIFAFVVVGYRTVKRELIAAKGKNTQTIDVEIIKIKVRQYPVGRFIYAVSCITIYYRFNGKTFKGYYIPTEHIAPHTVKKHIQKAKLTIYKDTKIIDVIDKDVFSASYGTKRDLV